MMPESTPDSGAAPITAKSRAAAINKAAQAAPSVVREKVGGAGPWYKVPGTTSFTSNPKFAEKDANGDPIIAKPLPAKK